MTGRRGVSALAIGVGVACSVYVSDLAPGPARSASPVRALFDLGAPSSGPFPTNWFTVRDPSHNTGRQVNLPFPDCNERPSDCEDIVF